MSTEVPIDKLIKAIWSERWKIVVFTTAVSFVTVLWLLSLPNKYTAQAVFIAESTESEGGLAGLSSSFGGIASLAGISLGSDNQSTIEAQYLLTAETFLLQIVEEYDLLPELVAAARYSFDTGLIEYDDSIYDSEADKWLVTGDQKSRRGQYPADWYAVSKLREMVAVTKDEETGLFTLKVEHVSPKFSKQFAEIMLGKINSVMRQRESEQLTRRLQFLEQQLELDNPTEIKQSIYALVEQQLKQKMIVETTESFIFKIIEPPQEPEVKSSPLRALLLILIIFVSGGFSIIYFGFRYIFLLSKEA